MPKDLQVVPRTIFANPNKPTLESYFDRIAWFSSGDGALLNMKYSCGGNFDFVPYVYTNTALDKKAKSYRISDHYPLWAEFSIS